MYKRNKRRISYFILKARVINLPEWQMANYLGAIA
jgi:hypothetical protein